MKNHIRFCFLTLEQRRQRRLELKKIRKNVKNLKRKKHNEIKKLYYKTIGKDAALQGISASAGIYLICSNFFNLY